MLLFFQLAGPGATTGYVFGGRTDERSNGFLAGQGEYFVRCRAVYFFRLGLCSSVTSLFRILCFEQLAPVRGLLSLARLDSIERSKGECLQLTSESSTSKMITGGLSV